jgi:hypothetical protein
LKSEEKKVNTFKPKIIPVKNIDIVGIQEQLKKGIT